jgi:hypothetical protein
MENKKVLRSGEFLVSEVEAKDVFIPEEFNDEQLMIAQTCKDGTGGKRRQGIDEGNA